MINTSLTAPEALARDELIADLDSARRGRSFADVLHDRKYRVDGWTPVKVACFLQMLADTGSVAKSAAYIRMSPSAAYQLRRHPDGAPFREAWDTALAARFEELSDLAFDRVRDGTPREKWYQGQCVGTETVFSDRLLIHLMTVVDPDRRRDAPPPPAAGDPGLAAAANGPGLLGWSHEDPDDYESTEDPADTAAFLARIASRDAANRTHADAGRADIGNRLDAALGRTTVESGGSGVTREGHAGTISRETPTP